MLSLFPLILAFSTVSLFFHKSLEIFLILGLVHFFLFGLLNYLGAYFLYKPIDHIFIHGGDTEKAKKRINRLTWYSTAWIFFLGSLFVVIVVVPLFLFPTAFSDR